jgi:hypothetical protein
MVWAVIGSQRTGCYPIGLVVHERGGEKGSQVAKGVLRGTWPWYMKSLQGAGRVDVKKKRKQKRKEKQKYKREKEKVGKM